MKILAIDQGNSRTKMTLLDGGQVVVAVCTDAPSLEEADRLVGQFGVDGAIYCSVAKLDVRFVESLRLLLPVPLLVMSARTPLPVKVDYASPATLGLDRVTAAAGASRLFPGESMLIVDAGTAVTLDILDDTNTFRGGNISPGMSLRFKALHAFTGKLPLVSAEGELLPFGDSTETAIRGGVVNGLTAEILDAVVRARVNYNVSRLVLTGGDAPFLLPLLEERIRQGQLSVKISIEPDLMALGLATIYSFNEKENY